MNDMSRPICSYRKIVFVFFILTFGSIAYAQDYNLPPLTAYPEATIGFKNYSKESVFGLKIGTDSISYQIDGRDKTQSLQDINYIRVRTGSKAGGGAGLGAVTMGVFVLIGVMQVESDPDLVYRDDAFGRGVLFVAGGALLGAAIGSSINQEVSYYIHSRPRP